MDPLEKKLDDIPIAIDDLLWMYEQQKTPEKKLQFALENSMFSMGRQLLGELMQQPADVVRSASIKQPYFDTLQEEEIKNKRQISDKEWDAINTRKQKRLEARICVRLCAGNQNITCDLDGLCQYMDWREHLKEQQDTFISKTVLSYICRKPVEADIKTILLLREIMRKYIPYDFETEKKVELWATITLLRTNTLDETLAFVKSAPGVVQSVKKQKKIAPITKRLSELGMKRKAIFRTMFACLKRTVKKEGHPETVYALAQMKYKGYEEQERIIAQLRVYFPCMVTRYVLCKGVTHSSVVTLLKKLGKMGMWHGGTFTKDTKLIDERLVSLMAEGCVEKAYRFLIIFGYSNEFSPHINKSWFKLKECKGYIKHHAQEAFDMAFANGQYGIAAALLQHFGAEACSPRPHHFEFQAKEFCQADQKQIETLEKNSSRRHEDEEKIRQAFRACQEKYERKLEELKQQQANKLHNVTILALKNHQPIALDLFSTFVDKMMSG